MHRTSKPYGLAVSRPSQKPRAPQAFPMIQRFLLACIDFYQRYLSSLKPPSCRFHPTCSQYGRTAILCHGWPRGCWLTATRLLRCHPFHPGGEDPVP